MPVKHTIKAWNYETNKQETKQISNLTPVRAIRLHCLECVGRSSKEVRECTSKFCALYPYRLGKKPDESRRKLTEKQKEVASKSLAKAREKRKLNRKAMKKGK